MNIKTQITLTPTELDEILKVHFQQQGLEFTEAEYWRLGYEKPQLHVYVATTPRAAEVAEQVAGAPNNVTPIS